MSNINVDNITPLAGTTGTVSVSGSLHVSGSVTANGNIVLGNEVGDSVSLGAEVSSSIIPDANNTYDLGSSAKTWKTMHQSTASIGVVSSSLIPDSTNTYDLGASTSQYKDLYVDGVAYIDEIGENVSSSGTITALNFIATGSEGNITASGNVLINGELSSATDVLQLGINVSGSLTSTGSFGRLLSHTIGGLSPINFTDSISVSGNVTASGNISASGTVECTSVILQHSQPGTSVDAAHCGSTIGNKFTIKNQLQAAIADGDTSALFTVGNTDINTDSVIYGTLNGTTTLIGGLSQSSLNIHVNAANSMSFCFVDGEGGETIADDTPFTASFVVF